MTDLQLADSDILYSPFFLEAEAANNYFQVLRKDLQWKQHNIKLFGKVIPQPRLTALYAINNSSYSYSGLTLYPKKYTKELSEISALISAETGMNFTHCLANLYRNERDSMGWHSDDEKELGINPVIASVSLGAERKFQLKHKTNPELKYQLELGNGSLLIMQGETQHYWKHQLPKASRPLSERINLTFRMIK